MRNLDLAAGFRRSGMIWLAVGVVLAAALGLFAVLAGSSVLDAVVRGWLIGWLAWLIVAFGSLGLTMLHYLVRAQWGVPLLRVFEAASSPRALLLLGICFLPVLFGLGRIYSWTAPANQTGYLNPASFTGRAVGYFVIWIAFSAALRRSSLRSAGAQWRTNVSAPGLVVIFLTGTFACFDWLMSLLPNWTSTIYGLLFVILSGLAALSFGLAFLRSHRRDEPYRGLLSSGLTRDFGNLLLTILLLWAYFTYSQYIVMWSGDIPREIRYFTSRADGWNVVASVLIALGFFGPLLALTAPVVKASINLLGALGMWLLLIAWLNLLWMTAPFFDRPGETPLFLYTALVASLAVGGLWRWAFLTSLAQAPLIVHGESTSEEALHVAT